jgi:geranylgeranyl diphosphate synthase, type II
VIRLTEGREPTATRLERYRDAALNVLLSAIPAQEPRRYLYDLIPNYPLRAGKGLRPGLCIATCLAFGGDMESAVNSAAAIEMLHNAFLVHDDISDESVLRRGSPTMHTEHGLGLAVNVGDAMNVMALGLLKRNVRPIGTRLTWQVLGEVEHMLRESVEGQAQELGWVRDNVCDVTEGDYVRMTLKKTCWYTCIHPCRIGALIATGGGMDLDRFNRFGCYLGAAFQIQDDLLNIGGDIQKYGKESLGDLYEGKRTLVLIHLLNTCTSEEGERLRCFLAKHRAGHTEAEVRWVYERMVHYDCIGYARRSSQQLAGAAMCEFQVAFGDRPDSPDKDLIRDIILYMVEREL